MKLSDGEKLIAIMLADLLEANGINGEVDPAFVKEAITGGDLWALKWEYPGLFHGEEPSDAIVSETADLLSMCSVIEFSISQLDPTDLAEIPANERTVFVGFDGNHDDHFGVANMMIEHMGRWSEFHGRNLNSHGTVLTKYRRMKMAYEAVGGAVSSPLSLDNIQSILAA